MRDHSGIAVFMGFNFKKVITASTRVERSTTVQHHAFTTFVDSLFQASLQSLRAAQSALRHSLDPSLTNLINQRIERWNAVCESPTMRR